MKVRLFDSAIDLLAPASAITVSRLCVAALVLASACGGDDGSATSGGGGGDGGSGSGATLCTQAVASEASCGKAISFDDPTCSAPLACHATCILSYPCNVLKQGACETMLCFTGTTGPGTGGSSSMGQGGSSSMGQGGSSSMGQGGSSSMEQGGSSSMGQGGSSSMGQGGSSSMGQGGSNGAGVGGSGATVHPECVAYASKYCACLGSVAAPDCLAQRTDICDSTGFYDCTKYLGCYMSASSCTAAMSCPSTCK